MATVKKSSRKKNVNDDFIISSFMEYVLKNNKEPLNSYNFCLDYKIEESDFYSFFGSFDSLKEAIWGKFFENTVATIQNEASYPNFSSKDKLLTLYYTLFEVLTLNRSYVLFYLKDTKNALKSFSQLRQFRREFKIFVDQIQDEAVLPDADRLNNLKKSTYSEGAWLQFLFLLKFWIEDTSKGFEKTDILIEKSVNTTVDLLDTKHLENLFDLGKFLWNERKNK